MSNKTDYTHQMINIATILHKDDKLRLGQMTIQNLHGENGWDDESGWYGDVFGISVYGLQVIGSSLNNSDYISDLDAVNILELKKQLSVNEKNVSLTEAQNLYYQKINSGEINRANYFKNVRPDVMETLKKQAFEDYFSKKYGSPVSFASPEANENYANELQKLRDQAIKEFNMMDDNQQISYLKNPIQYNFAKSLLNNSNEYVCER